MRTGTGTVLARLTYSKQKERYWKEGFGVKEKEISVPAAGCTVHPCGDGWFDCVWRKEIFYVYSTRSFATDRQTARLKLWQIWSYVGLSWLLSFLFLSNISIYLRVRVCVCAYMWGVSGKKSFFLNFSSLSFFPVLSVDHPIYLISILKILNVKLCNQSYLKGLALRTWNADIVEFFGPNETHHFFLGYSLYPAR